MEHMSVYVKMDFIIVFVMDIQQKKILDSVAHIVIKK